ncbi:hypothetical protein KJ785_00615 [Patescibacteria group bacterium]|nr:hypothetical protein [Patescibacteria group bacterium]
METERIERMKMGIIYTTPLKCVLQLALQENQEAGGNDDLVVVAYMEACMKIAEIAGVDKAMIIKCAELVFKQ